MKSWKRRRAPRTQQVGFGSTGALTTRQLTGLVLALASIILLVPAGARAANAFLNVIITDPANSTRQAHVDASGNLKVAGSVDVGNTPLSVTSTDDPGRQAFSFQDNHGMTNGSEGTSIQFTVPTGKRLVIQFVSALASLQSGQRLARADIQTESNGQFALYDLLPAFVGTFTSGGDNVVAAQDVTLYADGETDVILLVQRDSTTGNGELHGAVSGYLMDCSVSAPCG